MPSGTLVGDGTALGSLPASSGAAAAPVSQLIMGTRWTKAGA